MNSFRPCIVIPVYNHADAFGSIIDRLKRLNLPCLVVDDGSERTCVAALEEIAQSEPWLSLHCRDTNGGKGAAVCEGFTIALERGFTHALQVDADGQHDLSDVPKFFQVAEESPAAVVAGVRPYSAMPVSRRLGRLFTDAWVWVHTLSFSINDSMCGYRLYPLATTIAMLKNVRIGRRMDFDTDIIVRLFWLGLEVKQVATHVQYREENISHFDLWKDNLRISLMHTRLFFGMLVRLPRLLLRKFNRYS